MCLQESNTPSLGHTLRTDDHNRHTHSVQAQHSQFLSKSFELVLQRPLQVQQKQHHRVGLGVDLARERGLMRRRAQLLEHKPCAQSPHTSSSPPHSDVAPLPEVGCIQNALEIFPSESVAERGCPRLPGNGREDEMKLLLWNQRLFGEILLRRQLLWTGACGLGWV
eukprot:TRINITY_DN18461_c0_g1_i3.p1 TRINITY_DN18461_c0_g1~~TRINITY_DN18461_c0_g1_i3.p1  ORF type:complete len:166 (+),score=18.40 TRINITY_DN18461_c0_g1_i3:279-776(+)